MYMPDEARSDKYKVQSSGKDRLRGQKTLKVNGFLDEFEKDDIKKNIDIIELFESFNVKLSQKGKSFMGLCPFHEDHNPSLSVDREKGLYNCFGCGESGDIFSLVEKMKGLEFKEALNYLKGWKGLPRDKTTVTVTVGEGRGLPLPLPSTGLNTITDYYHKRFYEHPEQARLAVEYLRKRGIVSAELYERFQIGFSNGSLLSIIGENQKAELKENGILNNSLKEHFLNCVVFPIFDDNNQTVGIYGRDIDDASGFKHRYLKGPHCGVFNRKASKVYPEEMILTESIVDALTLIQVGFENVQAIYGTNGFTEEHLQTLREDRVKTVVFALDNDEAGQKASQALKERLVSEGFRVKMVFPFTQKDWNEELQKGTLKKDDLKTLIEQAAVFEPSTDSTSFTASHSGMVVRQDGQSTIFNINEVIYRVSGAKEFFITSLRVNIKAEFVPHQFVGPSGETKQTGEGEKYFDNLDLYSARSRSNFSLQLSRLFSLEPKRIEKDLIEILEYFEAVRSRLTEESGEKEKIEMTEAEREAGLKFLKDPSLFKEIVQDMNVLGYVGEDLNKQLLYLCASSRVLDDPISVLILSESASGKSFLVDTVKKLMPPEDVVAVTSLSDQALNYIKNLLHKFLILGEAVHSDVIEHQIREMLSGKELSRLVTLKDEKTGKMESKIVKTPVIVASVMSSTDYHVNPENASRCFLVNTDESREQTKRIHEAQRKKYSLERYFEKENIIPAIITKHQAAQRLLRKVLIVNPFAEALGFPDTLMRSRRDHDRFMDLIAVVCFLRQYQKEVKLNQTQSGQTQFGQTAFVECDLEDYRIAYEIMVKLILTSTLLEIPKGAMFLYEEIRKMTRETAKKSGIKPEEVIFTQRDIREYSKFNADSIKKYLKNLTSLEYIQITNGKGRGSRFSYRLMKDEELERFDLKVIPTPEEMQSHREVGKVGKSGEFPTSD